MKRKDNALVKLLVLISLLLVLRVGVVNHAFRSQNIGLKYRDIKISKSMTIPYFNDKKLNGLIDNYIKDNSCTKLDYNIFYIDSFKVNVFLDCNKKGSFIYDTKTSSKLNLVDITGDTKKLLSKISSLLKKKYPANVLTSLSVLDGTFNIKDNEIDAYYKDGVNVKVNNNEIKGIMDYDMKYDKEYTNEEYTIDKTKKHIAFTFDDGPAPYDIEIVDALNEYHAKATFFMLGNMMSKNGDAIKKIVDSGMEYGNHTFNHKALFFLDNPEIQSEITNTNNMFKNITNNDLTLLRPPYGYFKQNTIDISNMPIILWNVDTEDWKNKDTKMIYDEIMKAQDGDIILMHSLYAATKDAVKLALPALYENGYEVVSVSELFNLKGITLEPGKVYRSAN